MDIKENTCCDSDCPDCPWKKEQPCEDDKVVQNLPALPEPKNQS